MASGWWLVAGGWWLVAGGWWLVAGGWWLVAGGWWLVAGGWWLVVVAGGWWRWVRARGAVGMRSRASGVACLDTVAAPFIPNARLFVHFVHCSMDAQRRTRGSASLLWGLSSVDCGRGDYFIF